MSLYDFILEPIGSSKRASDVKASLFNFDFGSRSSKKKNASAKIPSGRSDSRRNNGKEKDSDENTGSPVVDEVPGPSSRRRAENESKKATAKLSKSNLRKKSSDGRNRRTGGGIAKNLSKSSLELESASHQELDDDENHPSGLTRRKRGRTNAETETRSPKDIEIVESSPSTPVQISKPVRHSSRRRLLRVYENNSDEDSTSSDHELSSSPTKKAKTKIAPEPPKRVPKKKSTFKDSLDRTASLEVEKAKNESATPYSHLKVSTKQKNRLNSKNCKSPVNSESEDSCVEVEKDDQNAVFVISENREDYMKLQNAHMTKNIMCVPEAFSGVVAGFANPDFRNAEIEYPGVLKTTVVSATSGNVAIGFIKVEGRTIMPPESCDVGKLIYWVIEGTITIKSAGGHYRSPQGSNNVYLYGKEFSAGVCLVIPKHAVYTLENWSANNAILAYCVMREDDNNS